MRAAASSSWILGAFTLGTLAAGTLSCNSAPPVATLSLELAAKGLVDVDGSVKLMVFDRDGVIGCTGPGIAVDPPPADRVFELNLTKCNANKSWCGSGSLPKDPERVLTWYVEGKKGTGELVFTGCTERAVDQDPVQIDLTASPAGIVAKCGNGAVEPPETCDTTGASDEACDGAKCATLEVVAGNGDAANFFHRGLPGRKKDLNLTFLTDKWFVAWTDGATGSGGGDGSSEFTLRRLTADVITDSTPAVLRAEVRLPTEASGATSSGTKRRSGIVTGSKLVAIESGNLLAVFVRDGKLQSSIQPATLGLGAGPDLDVAPTGDLPAVAGNGKGDAAIVWVDGGTVKASLRKADAGKGSVFSAPQAVSGGGVSGAPRVAYVGGDYVVVWAAGDDIKMRRLGPDGAPKGAEAVANAARPAGKQSQPDVAGFTSGEFVVVWRDDAGDQGADIRLQKFDKTGAATGTEIAQVVNDQVKAGDQDTPVVTSGTSTAGKRFYLVSWVSGQQIAARYVSADTSGYLWGPTKIANTEFMVGVGDKPRSTPAVACSPLHCAVGFVDESAGDQGASDDRVRVRRLPFPFTAK